jgi:carbon starvation protein
MNGMMLLCVALGYFALCYWLYGGFLTRLFGIDNSRQTPAVTRYDGIDYVPSHPAVLFGHHFSSIAGAGPIVGPIMASYFGWLPALLWILIGCVFVGAVHDFAALFLSVRNGGKSIGYVIEKLMGLGGRQLFLVFCWACLILVVAIFGLMVAGTFYTNPSVATASILFILMAPIFGFVSRRYLSLRSSSFIFVPLVFF